MDENPNGSIKDRVEAEISDSKTSPQNKHEELEEVHKGKKKDEKEVDNHQIDEKEKIDSQDHDKDYEHGSDSKRSANILPRKDKRENKKGAKEIAQLPPPRK